MISDEKLRLAQISAEVRHDKEHLASDKALVEQERQSINIEREKLEHVALQVKQRSLDIEEMVNVSPL